MIVIYIILGLLLVGASIVLVPPIIHGFKDGWNGTSVYADRYMIPHGETLEDDDDDTSNDDEITHYEIMIERRKEAAMILEHELETCTDSKKRVTLITRLNTLDKQTYNDMKRIEKLRSD